MLDNDIGVENRRNGIEWAPWVVGVVGMTDEWRIGGASAGLWMAIGNHGRLHHRRIVLLAKRLMLLIGRRRIVVSVLHMFAGRRLPSAVPALRIAMGHMDVYEAAQGSCVSIDNVNYDCMSLKLTQQKT